MWSEATIWTLNDECFLERSYDELQSSMVPVSEVQGGEEGEEEEGMRGGSFRTAEEKRGR